ncbi:MAG: AAA family ATPase [Gammaproteobacteria bacterium]|nr:AAA family ATPase [Gammaproteobacteria bacterium]
MNAGRKAIESALAGAVKVTPKNGSGSVLDRMTITTAAALTEQEFSPVRYLTEERIPRGLVLLVARPKMKKSWLALQAMVACVSGGDLLGKPTVKGRALGVMLEDNDRRMKVRLRFLGVDRLDRESRERLHLVYAWPKGEDGVAALHEWMDRYPDTGIIVIDVLQRFRGDQDTRKGAYALDYQALESLQALTKKHPDLTVLIVHHARKGGSEVQSEKVSGTFGIVGAADAYIILDSGTLPGTIHAHIDGRDWELWVHDFAWEWGESGWRHLRAITSDDQLTGKQREWLDFVRAEERTTPSDAAGHFGVTRSAACQQLTNLERRGFLGSDHGEYFVQE